MLCAAAILLLLAVTMPPCAFGALEVVNSKPKVTYIVPDTVYEYAPTSKHRGFFEQDFRIYCHRPFSKNLLRIFENIELQLEIDNEEYTQYEGETPEQVEEHYDERRSLFSLSLFSQKRARLPLSPFEQRCIGIDTVQPYRIKLIHENPHLWRAIQMVLGVIVFLKAGHLSNNSIFYYISGIILGICSSFMLIIWLSSKLLPRRTMMYGALISGWGFGIYILNMLWGNLQTIVVTYREYVLWYILVTGIVSFLFCYRLGPPKNQRSKNIVKWVLQLMSLLAIYLCSHFNEATFAVIFMTISWQYFPRSVRHKVISYYRRRFPGKRRLLTSEEFYEQGVKETCKALDELRTYVRSPECKQWELMQRLKDPRLFASFVEGDSHLQNEELLEYEHSKHAADVDISDSESNESAEQDIRSQPIIAATQLRPRAIDYVEFDDDDDQSENEEQEVHSLRNSSRSYVSAVQRAEANVPNGSISPRYSTYASSARTSARLTPNSLTPRRLTPSRRTPISNTAERSSYDRNFR